jgi:hypothetical protein
MSAWLTTRNSVLSTFNAVNINYSTLSGTASNTITTRQINYSTLMGSTIVTNTIGGNAMTTGTLVTTGNVGIGTVSPIGILQIACTSSTNQANAPDGGGSHGLVFTSPKTGSTVYAMAMGVDFTTGYGYINGAGNSTGQPILLQSRGGNVGIEMTNPNAPLQFASTTANRKIVLYETTNNDHQYFGFGVNANILRYQVDSTNANHVFYAGASTTTSNELMRILGNGNVGIGTASPSSLLHVNGNIKGSSLTINEISATDVSSNWAPTNVTPAYVNFIFARGWPGRFADGIVFNTYLDSTGGSPNMLLLSKNGIGMRIYQQTFGSASSFYSGSYADVVLQNSSGNVGIGITNPSSILHVNGTTTFGNGNGTSNSNTNAGTITAPASSGQAYGSTATNYYGTKLHIYGGNLSVSVWDNSNYGGDIVLAAGDVISYENNGTVGGSYVGGNAVIRSGRVAVNNVAGNTQTVIPGSIFFQIGSGSRNTSSSLGDYNTAMTINSSGNVGIGTQSPFGILQIACTSSTNQATAPDGGTGHGLVFTSPKVSSGTVYAMVMGVDFTTGYGYINGAGNTTVQPILLQSRGGNVGIGTTNPSSLLHVNGNIKVNNDINCKSITIGETPGDPQAFITARTIPSGQGAMSERNELILFMSNDPDNTSGPDTITLRAPYIRLQTYTDANVADINNNNGSNDRLIINSSGNVGIGITNPGFPFTVYGGEGLTYTAGGNNPYIMSPTLSIQNTSAYGAVCAWFQRDVIVGGAMGTFSDIRIKNNIKPAINLLDKINQITIVSHEFIDPFKTPSETSIAVIAQDIINVIPDAVMFNKEVIPNIMQVPISCILLDDIVVITCSNSMDINVNDTVQLILASSNKDCIVSYISDDRKIIYVPKWDNINLLNDQIFIYGKYVNDFHIVDKPKLGLLALGGVKELHQIIKEQQSQINQLLAWAKTQGFQ